MLRVFVSMQNPVFPRRRQKERYHSAIEILLSKIVVFAAYWSGHDNLSSDVFHKNEKKGLQMCCSSAMIGMMIVIRTGAVEAVAVAVDAMTEPFNFFENSVSLFFG